MRYHSTRGGERGLTASQAILKGLAEDGGLFMPERLPKLSLPIEALSGLSYQELAYLVMKEFLTDFTEEELRHCINAAYDEKFDTAEIVPLEKRDGVYFLELFHGRTIAFKDMALSILPHLMTTAARKQALREKIVILTATSGDTGKAAMEGFADVPGTEIIVFYPKDGVSRFQELQMRTQQGENTHVVAIEGNFDDAQSGVKEIFSDRAFEQRLKERGYVLSSANSINIGRLVPQIVYYVYAYVRLLERGELQPGELVNICVPTGNFGNILAAWLAKQLGLPVGKLLCASNENRVLTDFFLEGAYDKNREFILTSSPSMDILLSSNLERLVYLACGGDSERCCGLMEALKAQGRYELSPDMRAFMADFVGGSAKESEVFAAIRRLKDKSAYVMDTHTAVAMAVYERYREESGDNTKTLIAATASPFKFAPAVMAALGETGAAGMDATEAETAATEGAACEPCTADAGKAETAVFALIERLSDISGVALPPAVDEVRKAQPRHDLSCQPGQMRDIVAQLLP